jgi:hypothetical protein
MKSLAFTLIATLLTPSMSFAQGGGPTWSAVHKWKPGAEATVTAHGIVGKRYFIAADDSGVTLLNVSYGVPAHVAKLLRHAAAEQPERFPVREGVTFVLDERASITSAGLFVAGQKIAEHDRIVERIQRNDVETGAVFLVVNKEWSITKQVLITLGVAVLSGISAMLIVCAAGRCD